MSSLSPAQTHLVTPVQRFLSPAFKPLVPAVEQAEIYAVIPKIKQPADKESLRELRERLPAEKRVGQK